jgi:hypothetical protein
MNRRHNRHLHSHAHTLPATVRNWRPALPAPEPPSLSDGRDRERV